MGKYKKMIEAAYRSIYKVARKTSLDPAIQLSERQNNNVWLKREDQQPVFSYKIRGAYNLLSNLTEEQKNKGVIAASAGNHAQGITLAGNSLNMKSVIVMPKTTPNIKVEAVKRLGAEVILHGNNYDAAKDYALNYAEEHDKFFVSPYEHPLLIAGQATVAIEILEQHPERPDIIFVPIGGGGLIAGIIAYLKEAAPDITVIGVEPDEAPCMHNALAAGRCVKLDNIGIFADGAAVGQAGEEAFNIIKDKVAEIMLINTDEICSAIKDIFENTRSIAEPAGALALAGLKKYVARERIKGKELVAILSGANVNFDRLSHIAELANLGENRQALIGVVIPEKPGSFLKYCRDLGPRQITEFNYRYHDGKTAHVFTGLQLRNGLKEKSMVLNNLKKKGYEVIDLSNDEVTKMHVRYMVGGRGTNIENELLYRFEFPERSGALLHFLGELSGRWNISLFHYRNHGAAYCRVLTGMQVAPEEQQEFQQFLDSLGIPYWDETGNTAHKMFLG